MTRYAYVAPIPALGRYEKTDENSRHGEEWTYERVRPKVLDTLDLLPDSLQVQAGLFDERAAEREFALGIDCTSADVRKVRDYPF